MAVLKLSIMYRKIKFVLSFVFIIHLVSAQITLTIPPGNPPTDTISLIYAYADYEEARKPLGTYWGYERTAFIFSHSEIGMYGQITSIAVYCDSANNPSDVPLKIYVRETTDSMFTFQTTVANEEEGALLVYSGTIPADTFAKNQWVTINFSTPFTHATHNKAIEFIFETNAGGTGNEGRYGKFFTHYQPANDLPVSQYWNEDGSPPILQGVTLSYYRPNVQMTINSILGCGGMPTNAGTIVATSAYNADSLVDTLCINQGVVLSLSGTTPATGLAYQWQDSIIGRSSFANIPGADSTVLLTSLTNGVTTWYRCKLKCVSAHDSTYSSVKQITLRNYLNCYCTAGLGGGCDFNSAIDSIAIPGTTLANGLTGCSPSAYTLYPYSGNTTATLNQGSTYSLYTRYNGNVSSSFWVDYNQNGILEPSEWTQICLQSPSIYDTMTVDGVLVLQLDSLISTSFTVPIGAVQGKTLLRVRSRSAGSANDSLTVCDYFGSGEIEDYYVTITSPAGINKVTGITNQVTVYPNPANTIINLSISQFDNEKVNNLEIYNIVGECVHREIATSSNCQINVADLLSGVYFIKLNTRQGICTQKFIIAR